MAAGKFPATGWRLWPWAHWESGCPGMSCSTEPHPPLRRKTLRPRQRRSAPTRRQRVRSRRCWCSAGSAGRGRTGSIRAMGTWRCPGDAFPPAAPHPVDAARIGQAVQGFAHTFCGYGVSVGRWPGCGGLPLAAEQLGRCHGRRLIPRCILPQARWRPPTPSRWSNSAAMWAGRASARSRSMPWAFMAASAHGRFRHQTT